MKKVLSVLLIFMLLFSAVYAFPFNTASAQEEETTLKTDTYLPEEEYTEEIYEGTGSLEYAFDGTFIRDYVDNEMLDEAGHVARINEEEELNTYVFLNRDGTKSVYYMDDNVRYVDENGEMVEKDLTIIRKNKGYTLKANDVKLWFPDVLSDGISVKYDKYHLTLYPQGVADTEEVIIDEYGRLTYPGVFGENTVLAYTPTLSGLKEDIILSEYTGQLSYDFLIHTHGMRILEEEGKYIVKKPGNGNKETFELGAVQIYDSAGNFCVGEMKITEQNNGSKYILTLIAPEEFLTDPNTVYPVTIDPTITVSDNLNGANSIEDSVIYSGTPNSNYGGFTYLTVGYGDSTYGVGRAIFRLPGLYNSDLYNSLSASQITSVKFYTWDASGHDNLPIEILANVNIPWTESGVKWNNAPGGYPGLSPVTAYMPSGNFACFDITSIVEWWKAGNSPAGGFTMKNPNETNDIYKKVPCSSETAITDRRPYVVMTYEPVISLSDYSLDILEGNTKTLTATTVPENATVIWSTNNNTVATVDASGVITAKKAGIARIYARISDNGTAYSVFCTVYVRISNGVYYFNNKSNNYRIELYNYNAYIDGSPLYVFNSGTAAPTNRYEFFRINYLGNGLYSIRSLLDSKMGWTQSSSSVKIDTIGSSTAEIPNESKWYIKSNSNGYYIHGYYGTTYTLTGASTSGYKLTLSSYSSSSLLQNWELTHMSVSYHGVNIRDKTSTLAVGDAYTFSASVYSTYSYINGQHGFYWRVINGTGSATIDSSTGALTGTSQGTVTVRATYNYGSSPWYDEFDVEIIPVKDGEYYFKNKGTLKCMQPDDNGDTHTEQLEFNFSLEQRWQLIHNSGSYYYIINSSTGKYLTAPEDSTSGSSVSTADYSYSIRDRQLWKISSISGQISYKIQSKNQSESNLVLAVGWGANWNGINVEQKTFSLDTNYKDEWVLHTIDCTLPTPLIAQTTDMWCWVASAQMLARTKHPTDANNGNLNIIQQEQRDAVYHVFGDDTTTSAEYDWNTDTQGLNDQGGIYTDVAKAAAYLVGITDGEETFSGYATPYSEESLLQFLLDGHAVARLYGWTTATVTPPNTTDELLTMIQSLNPNSGGHVTVIVGAEWSSAEQRYMYTVYDPGDGGKRYNYTYDDLLFEMVVNGDNYRFTCWFPTVVTKTEYSDGFDNILGYDFSSN